MNFVNSHSAPANRVLFLTPAALLAIAAGCESGSPQRRTHVVTVTSPQLMLPPAPPTPAPIARSTTKTNTFASANVTRVTHAEEGADFDPSVSRDGEKIVFASTQHRASSDIYVKKIGSNVVTQLTSDPAEDAMPVISPDGQRIAFASNRTGNWDIFVMPMNGGKAVQVTNDVGDELHPSWSADGSSLVFCRLGETSGRWEMWISDSGGSGSTNFIGYGMFPEWCPTAGTGEAGADRILFQLGRERGRRTYSIWSLDYKNSSAGNLTEIASSAESALINPTWSPDGQWIAFAEIPVSDLAANSFESPETPMQAANASRKAATKSVPDNSSLWMVNIDGTNKVNLASGAGGALMPSWGSQNRLFFVSQRSGTENIWSIDLAPAFLATSGHAIPTTHPVATGDARQADETTNPNR